MKRVILSAGAMLIFSVSFQIDQMPEGEEHDWITKYIRISLVQHPSLRLPLRFLLQTLDSHVRLIYGQLQNNDPTCASIVQDISMPMRATQGLQYM